MTFIARYFTTLTNKKPRPPYPLRDAAKRGELILHYQPKVDMTTSMTVGVEALLRWQHPTLGLLHPDTFKKAFQNEQHIAIDLAHWVIEQGIKQLSEWQKRGISIPISVNVMASELTSQGFYEWLTRTFEKYPTVEPSLFELEIIESSNLTDLHKVVSIIKKCKLLGIKVALDDFGTAYSSLAYIRNIPSDHIKIDKMFIHEIAHNNQDKDLLTMIIALSDLFKRKTIAEGVESIEQGIVLIGLGCKVAQGFAIAKPMPACELPNWVNNYKTHPQWAN